MTFISAYSVYIQILTLDNMFLVFRVYIYDMIFGMIFEHYRLYTSSDKQLVSLHSRGSMVTLIDKTRNLSLH